MDRMQKLMGRSLSLHSIWGVLLGMILWGVNTSFVVPEKSDMQNVAPLRWYSLDEAMDHARKNDKKVLIFVHTDWCGYCRMMQKKAFTHPEVVKYMTEKVCPVRLNAWTKEDIWFQGYKFTFMPELHIHQLAYQLLDGKMEYPTSVFLTYRGEVLSPVKGYMEHKQFLKVLRYYGDDIYLKQTWDQYKNAR